MDDPFESDCEFVGERPNSPMLNICIATKQQGLQKIFCK